jgi:(E)-4-hydroxy-3-methylbut-2-enyl-diphosphate synthase
MSNSKYCNSLTSYSRRESRVVHIGEIPMGGNHPIRIQSMTTTNTMDTIATVEQSIRMIDAGCEYVRITAPSKKEAENLANIKIELKNRGYETPLIADIHFTPNAAEVAARIVEKVRINPGNFVDRKKFEQIEYTDAEYDGEIQRIRDRFLPLVNICKEYGTAMRIGTNHGSLSDRILSRYGDTPMGMVESALEFLRICRAENYHEIILSMKSSNPLVMVQAYRLLVNRMDAEGMDYPLHLGVTEAGEGEDGRIKSALGIGTLLEDGLGDTIRVSLTEEPEYEIPVAKTLVDRYKNRSTHDEIPEIDQNPILPFEYNPRKTHTVLNIGGENVPRVINDLNLLDEVTPKTLSELGYTYFEKEDKWGISDVACDFIDIGKKEINFEIPGTLGIIQAYSVWKNFKKDRHYPFLDLDQYMDGTDFHPQLNMLYMTYPQLSEEVISKIKNDSTIVLFSDTYNEHGMAEQRRMFVKLMNAGCTSPVIIGRAYGDLSTEDLQVYASTDMGALMVDGLGDGIYITAERCGSLSTVNGTAFGVLQASRTRITKTEYISCPSCGRTLFDLQETTARIRSRTEHLKGVKIGIMGCIVNGPGEMADADYGYVGTGVGKITLYKGQEVVSKNMPYEEADEALIQLIKDHGDWVEPKAVYSY